MKPVRHFMAAAPVPDLFNPLVLLVLPPALPILPPVLVVLKVANVAHPGCFAMPRKHRRHQEALCKSG